MKHYIHNPISWLRNRTPLSIRQMIGPVISYTFYLLRVYLHIGKLDVRILSISETLDQIHEKNLSVIRYGDGEITLLDGDDLMFQKHDPKLEARLREILSSIHPQLLVCVTDIWNDLNNFMPYARTFNMHQAYRMYHVWREVLQKGRTYGETNITRHYLAYRDKARAADTFKRLFLIWRNKDVVLIEGEKSRLGVGNDMFDEVKSLERILCPSENAFDSYDRILASVKKMDKDKLVLLSLGPTAKVLAYDLFLLGYRVIDIGHIDMEYEMFLRNSTSQVKVRYKYFNEIHERNPEECTDDKYLSQVIDRIN